MQRFAAVWHASPQKMVGVLFALLLAAMMAVGSGANFNSTSANPGNVVTAGNLKHTNTGALLTVDKIKPGETKAAGTVTIQNTGDIDGVFTVDNAVVNDSTAPANPFAEPPRGQDHLRRRPWSTTASLNAMSAEDRRHDRRRARRNTYTFAVKFLDGGTRRRRQRSTRPRAATIELQLGGREQLGLARGTDTMPRSSARRLASKAAGGLGRLVLLAGVLVLAATFLPSLLGYQRYVLVGHSMEPTIHKGSLVFDEIVPAEALRRGDVITYIPPDRRRSR